MKFAVFLILIAALLASTLDGQNAPSGPVQMPPPSATGTPASVNPTYQPTQTATTDIPGDIRDIHGPISIPYEYLWIAYLLGSLALAAALYYGWRAYQKHAKAKAKLPHELALERLEAARVLMTENQVREYAFEVSEIVRRYIEQRFGERAARRTTEEFLSDLLRKTGTPLAEHRDLLEDFLNHCDLPKFARWQLSIPEMEAMHESARSFIINTKPQPKPASSKIGAPAQPELAPAK
jgi:hypothetical protein